jgi:hypothetical protein
MTKPQVKIVKPFSTLLATINAFGQCAALAGTVVFGLSIFDIINVHRDFVDRCLRLAIFGQFVVFVTKWKPQFEIDLVEDDTIVVPNST